MGYGLFGLLIVSGLSVFAAVLPPLRSSTELAVDCRLEERADVSRFRREGDAYLLLEILSARTGSKHSKGRNIN